MDKIKHFFDFGLDFLFPANEQVHEIQTSSPEDLLSLLPKSENDIESTATLFAYSDERVKQLVWEIKYYKNETIAKSVGILLAQQIKKTLLSIDSAQKYQPFDNWRRARFDSYFVIPIPQTNKRFKERGFHHTRLLAESVVENLPANFSLQADVLQKIKHTPKQHSIADRSERFANIAGAFSVPVSTSANISNSTNLIGKNIVLIDDVITTGATVTEAMRALKAAGAANVLAFAIAH